MWKQFTRRVREAWTREQKIRAERRRATREYDANLARALARAEHDSEGRDR